jgi:hypothetical protein
MDRIKDNIKNMANVVGICGIAILIAFYILGNEFGMGYGLASMNVALIFRHYHKKNKGE